MTATIVDPKEVSGSTLEDSLAEPKREAFCLFQTGTVSLSISLDSVVEVLEIERIVRLPRTSPEILGLCPLRRELIPIVSLGDPRQELAGKPSLPLLSLIVRCEHGLWALKIETTGTSIFEECMETEDLDPLPGSSLVLQGSLRRAGHLYGVIDPQATWRKLREQNESRYLLERGRESASLGRSLSSLERFPHGSSR